jgi:Kef-type K+ transport system membrane component KefB
MAGLGLSASYFHASPLSLNSAGGSGHSTGVGEIPLASILISLVVIWLGAKMGGELSERFRQPAVLGELLFGIFLGSLTLVGLQVVDFMRTNEFIFLLAEIGVVLLLFEVGLESNILDMMEVGLSSFLVAMIGVITPFGLGWATGFYFLPEAHPFIHVFLGATLAATSVGITARVLKDLGKTKTREARIILGAAVIDDVLGLILLAVVSGVIQATGHGMGSFSGLDILLVLLKATLFLILALWLGSRITPRVFNWASRLRIRGMLLVTSISFCFLLAYLASLVKLAPLVGAFAAGLILEPIHYADFKQREERSIEDLISPLTTLFVPVFFVYMGLQVDLRAFSNLEVLALAVVLTLSAIAGKLVCAAGPVEKGLDRLSIGVGMIPRGEVGLIFAGMGLTLWFQGAPILRRPVYSALVIMVILTTLVTPVALKMTFARNARTWGNRNQSDTLVQETAPLNKDN